MAFLEAAAAAASGIGSVVGGIMQGKANKKAIKEAKRARIEQGMQFDIANAAQYGLMQPYLMQGAAALGAQSAMLGLTAPKEPDIAEFLQGRSARQMRDIGRILRRNDVIDAETDEEAMHKFERMSSQEQLRILQENENKLPAQLSQGVLPAFERALNQYNIAQTEYNLALQDPTMQRPEFQELQDFQYDDQIPQYAEPGQVAQYEGAPDVLAAPELGRFAYDQDIPQYQQAQRFDPQTGLPIDPELEAQLQQAQGDVNVLRQAARAGVPTPTQPGEFATTAPEIGQFTGDPSVTRPTDPGRFAADERIGRFGGFGAEDLELDPGYQFRLEEGQKALERSAAARGMLQSGATLKDLQRFGQGLAAQEFAAARGRAVEDVQLDRQRQAAQFGQDISAFGTNLQAQQAYEAAQRQAEGQQFGQELGAYQAGLGAQQQQFGQDIAGFGTNLQAQQAYEQMLMQAQQQQFGQLGGVAGQQAGLGQTQAGLTQQEFQNLMALSEAGYGRELQEYGLGVEESRYAQEQARLREAQQYARARGDFELANQLEQQQFALRNQQEQAQYQRGLQTFDIQRQQEQQQYQRDLSTYGLRSQTEAQQYQRALQQHQMGQQTALSNFGQQYQMYQDQLNRLAAMTATGQQTQAQAGQMGTQLAVANAQAIGQAGQNLATLQASQGANIAGTIQNVANLPFAYMALKDDATDTPDMGSIASLFNTPTSGNTGGGGLNMMRQYGLTPNTTQNPSLMTPRGPSTYGLSFMNKQ